MIKVWLKKAQAKVGWITALYEILHPFFTKAVSNADCSRWNVVVELYIECFGMHLVCNAFGLRWTWYLMNLVCNALHTFTAVCRPVEWVAPFKCHIHNTRTAQAIPALHGGNFCEKIFRSRGTLKIHIQNAHIHCAPPGYKCALDYIVS